MGLINLAEELTTTELCEGLIRHLETAGGETLEKNYILKNGSIHASVFVIVGENAEEMTGLVREWFASKGLKRTQ
jgi:hypothetical protein